MPTKLKIAVSDLVKVAAKVTAAAILVGCASAITLLAIAVNAWADGAQFDPPTWLVVYDTASCILALLLSWGGSVSDRAKSQGKK